MGNENFEQAKKLWDALSANLHNDEREMLKTFGSEALRNERMGEGMSADSKVNFIARVKEMIDEHRLEITGLGAGKIKKGLDELDLPKLHRETFTDSTAKIFANLALSHGKNLAHAEMKEYKEEQMAKQKELPRITTGGGMRNE
ncbi:MAG: hypothetical protein AABW86_04450 [Candidatus Micrarchaeota archaeon]